MRCFSFCAAVLLALVGQGHAHGQGDSSGKPVRRINLQSLGYGQGNSGRIAFCGQSLVLFRDGQQLSQGGSCDGLMQGQVPDSSANPHIVARRKQMAIEEVCDQVRCSEAPGSPRIRNVKYYLKTPDRPPALLFEDHCLGAPPIFLSDEYVLYYRCNLKSVVVDVQGKQVYELPVFAFPYVAVSRGGTRFAVYERDVSFWHGLAGTIDRIRVSVFQTSNGKRLFNRGWHSDESGDGLVALSDDGSLLAVVHSGEVLVYSIPVQ